MACFLRHLLPPDGEGTYRIFLAEDAYDSACVMMHVVRLVKAAKETGHGPVREIRSLYFKHPPDPCGVILRWNAMEHE